MNEHVSIPFQWRESGQEQVEAWVHRALEHTAAMPPKKPKPAK